MFLSRFSQVRILSMFFIIVSALSIRALSRKSLFERSSSERLEPRMSTSPSLISPLDIKLNSFFPRSHLSSISTISPSRLMRYPLGFPIVENMRFLRVRIPMNILSPLILSPSFCHVLNTVLIFSSAPENCL